MNKRSEIRAKISKLCPYKHLSNEKHIHSRVVFRQSSDIKFNKRGNALINPTEESYLSESVTDFFNYYRFDREVFPKIEFVQDALKELKKNGYTLELMHIQPECQTIVFILNIDRYVFWAGYYFKYNCNVKGEDLTNYFISEKDLFDVCYSPILKSKLTYSGFILDICPCLQEYNV